MKTDAYALLAGISLVIGAVAQLLRVVIRRRRSSDRPKATDSDPPS